MSDIEQRIRQRAFQLWEQAGCPHARSEEFWFAARQEIEGDVPPIGDRPGGAIDYPPDERTVEDPPEVSELSGLPTEAPESLRHTATAAAPKPPTPERPTTERPAPAAQSQTTRKAAAAESAPPKRPRPAPARPAPRPDPARPGRG